MCPSSPDLAPLIYASNCRILGITPAAYATLPAHRRARWARVAGIYRTYATSRPWSFGQCLYEAVHIDTYARRWHNLHPDEQEVWKDEGYALALHLKQEAEAA